jgi:hypothetical protein
MKATAKKMTTPVGSVTTTIALPVAQWKALKIRAAQERAPLRDICARAIIAYLATPLPPEEA